MPVRRVITGHDAEGRSVIVDDAAVEPITSGLVPGFAAHEVWKLGDTATLPTAEPPRGPTAYHPPPDGVRFQVITIPPAGAAVPGGLDVAAEVARLEGIAPGIVTTNETDDPGVHTPPTRSTTSTSRPGPSSWRSTTASRSSCGPGTRSCSAAPGTRGATAATHRA